MKYKIILEYDGSNYFGWQSQKDQKDKTIEDVLQNAIFAISNESPKINCAGRTDSGVHAIGQVADFSLNKNFSSLEILMALNHYLRKSNISVVDCEIASDDFHSRYDAKIRSYFYLIVNRKAPLSLQKNRAWHIPCALNVEDMKNAANFLIGTRDFSCFRDAKCQALSPIKTIKNIEIIKNCDEIKITISAKSFLHHMVRNIVGTLVLVGEGKIDINDFIKIVEGKDRTKSGQNAPACGLYFAGVEY